MPMSKYFVLLFSAEWNCISHRKKPKTHQPHKNFHLHTLKTIAIILSLHHRLPRLKSTVFSLPSHLWLLMFQYSLPVLVWKWWSLEEDREKSWRKKPLNLLLQICGKSSLRVLEDFSIVMRTYPVNWHNLKERTALSPRGRFHFLVIFRSALFQIYLSKNLPTLTWTWSPHSRQPCPDLM